MGGPSERKSEDAVRRFAEFHLQQIEADVYELRKENERVPLRWLPAKLLWILTAHADQTLTKKQLSIALFSNEEHVDDVRRQIALIRDAIGDDADAPTFIETIPRVGYRFMVPVTTVVEMGDHARESTNVQPLSETHPSLPTKRSRSWIVWLVAVILASPIVFMVVWRLRPSNLEEVVMNDTTRDLVAVSLAPNGQQVAFADTGVYVRGTEDSAHPRRLNVAALERVSGVSWSSDGKLLFLTGDEGVGQAAGLWRFDVVSNDLLKILGSVGEAAIAQDGKIASIAANRNALSVCEHTGENCRNLFTSKAGDVLNGIAWQNTSHIVFGSFSANDYQLHLTLRVVDVGTGDSTVVLEDKPVTAFCTTKAGRLLYATAEPKAQGQYDARLWETEIHPMARRQQLKEWADSIISGISASEDGMEIAILRGRYAADVYVAEIDPLTKEMSNHRLLTKHDANDFPTAWTADSKRVIFHSDRLGWFGTFGLFTQGIEETDAKPLVQSRLEDVRGARVSADGRWIAYYRRNLPHVRRKTWMRIGIDRTSESSHLPLPVGNYDVRCPREPTKNCVALFRDETAARFIDFNLDSGLGREICKFDIADFGRDIHWAVDPEGDRLAVLRNGTAPESIMVVSWNGEQTEVNNVGNLQSLDWAADGNGWYASAPSGDGSNLVYIDQTGKRQVLHPQVRNFVTWAVPSPNGRHIAYLQWTASAKVYVLRRRR